MTTPPDIKRLLAGSSALMRSRVVELSHGQERSTANNRMTGVAVLESVAPPSFRDAFELNYDDIKATVTRFSDQGLAIVAVDRHTRSVAGSLCLSAKTDIINTGIVGRHSACDLFLAHDASVSLRHLLVVIDPVRSWDAGDTRFRVLDLRTRSAFSDEHGNRVEAIVSEGPAFLSCGDYLLFCVPTGGMEWPDSAADGWDCLPDRVYVQESAAEPDRHQRKQPLRPIEESTRVRPPDFNRRVTYVGAGPGPVPSQFALLQEGEAPLGLIEIGGDRGARGEIAIGSQAAKRGVLLGRYHRCDGGTGSGLSADAISRVHLLLLQIDSAVYAIDAGSSNGTWLVDEDSPSRWKRVRCLRLHGDESLCLGTERTELTWHAR